VSDRGPEPEDHRALLQVAGCLYTLLLLAALLWLWARDALEALPRMAVGSHGVLVSGATGLGAGLLGSLLLALAARRFRAMQSLERKVATMMGELSDAQILALSVFGALAEELFFRLAVLDALGLEWSVALFVVLNTGPGFWAWAPVALLMAVGFGAMVVSGFGLLSVTAAHALINYLTLRRILIP
jgi:membrane protease YdiL (CAAX protease family)